MKIMMPKIAKKICMKREYVWKTRSLYLAR